MWMTRGAALSDVVLAPAGAVLGSGLLGVLLVVPGWPGGLLREVVGLVVAIAAMLVWPAWLARQRGDRRATGTDLDAGALPNAALVAAPTVVAGVLMGLLQGLPLNRAVFGQLASLPVSAFGMVRVVLVLVMAVGTFLVLALAGRRAPQAFDGAEMSLTAGLRTYGLGLAGAATLLQMLFAVGTGRPAVLGLVIGGAMTATVLLTDRMIPASLTASRGTVLTTAVIAGAVWLLGGVLFSGGSLLPRLALASTAATLAMCIGALVTAGRTWSAVLLPLAASLWLVSILPVVG